MATRLARATGDCFRLLLRLPPVLRPEDDPPFREALLLRPRELEDFRVDVFRVDVVRVVVFRVDVFRRDDFRAPDFRLLDLRLDAPPRLPADRPDDELLRDPPLFFRAPDFREPPLREPPRDDFLLDAMNSLLVRWWYSDE